MGGGGEREGKKTPGPSEVVKVKNTGMGGERPHIPSITTEAALEVPRTALAAESAIKEKNVYYS